MTYAHNVEADFAGSELARMFAADPSLCYAAGPHPAGLSATATYEPSSSPWPKADGVVSLLESGTGLQRDIAIEYKRQQEGVHGLLTAIGQAQAYLHKGYHGAAVVIPAAYSTHGTPGSYLKEVLDHVGTSRAVGVFSYRDPDTASATPFAGKLHCARPLAVIASAAGIGPAAAGPKTQWVHMREGSTTRDAFFRFLQTAKLASAGGALPNPLIPPELTAAIARIAPSRDPAMYLSNTADDKFLSRVWRAFWFEWIATSDVLKPWTITGTRYVEPNVFTRVQKDDGTGFSQIFEGRTGSLKSVLVEKLDSGALSEDQGWEHFASGLVIAGRQKKQGVRDRAHSYREDLDSSLSHLQWIDPEGRPTDAGYRYMSLCERYGGANSDAAIQYVGATLLQSGRYAAFLHYVHRLSEQRFAANPLAFTRIVSRIPTFNDASYTEYLLHLEEKMSDELKVMRKVSGRARPRHRTPFQAELTLLRNYGFVSKRRYRLGVGIPIDWEKVLSSLSVEI